ncbi:MAG TPA: FAD/NAD(P)-binding oxidoreductase [Candidatus Nitrosopolaris sp.]|nr:FAD/NAD(P)-binding oxidoreductase [Candidatus Nitrosopolaris sp.]
MLEARSRIVILGAGFGGLTAANMLRRGLSAKHQIVVIDKKDFFLMGIVNLWILAGNRRLEESKISLSNLKNKGIEFLHDEVIQIDFHKNIVTTKLSKKIEYDYLILGLGVDFAIEQVNGFTENGGFNLYDVAQVPKLREKILALKNGKLAICITDIPYKCPPAPYEASLIIDDILTQSGIRDSIEMDLYTPTQIALPVAGPTISQNVINLLNGRNINFHPLHKLKRVSNEELEFGNGTRMDYDVLIGIPPHKTPKMVTNCPGLLKAGEYWINVDKFTLRTNYEKVFAIGDITEIKVNQNVAIPKAGIFAEAEAKVVSQQIIDEITNNNKSQNPRFDGKGYCFMEIGGKKAGYIFADFYNEPNPITKLETPSQELYEKKIDFERSRLAEWLA